MSSVPPSFTFPNYVVDDQRQRYISLWQYCVMQDFAPMTARNYVRVMCPEIAIKPADAWSAYNQLKAWRQWFTAQKSLHSNFIDADKALLDVHRRESMRAAGHQRRVLIKAAGDAYTPEEWLALCDRFDNLCACCHQASPLTVDHVIPVSRGGRNTIDNLQCLCGPCNSSKGTKKTDYRPQSFR